MHTDKETVEESAAKIARTLEMIGYIPSIDAEAEYSAEEEEEIKQRLKALGYI